MTREFICWHFMRYHLKLLLHWYQLQTGTSTLSSQQLSKTFENSAQQAKVSVPYYVADCPICAMLSLILKTPFRELIRLQPRERSMKRNQVGKYFPVFTDYVHSIFKSNETEGKGNIPKQHKRKVWASKPWVSTWSIWRRQRRRHNLTRRYWRPLNQNFHRNTFK